jgi:hypothetical protein
MTVATAASRHLVALAEEVTAAYVALTAPRAVLLTGSAARGDSDYYSDIDLLIYYDEKPGAGALRAVGHRLGVEDAGGTFTLEGVECQAGLVTVAETEEWLAEVLERFVARTMAQKIVEGILAGRALHGADLIGRWQARAAAYPDGLARSMVEAHLRFFPLWQFPHTVATRDTALWAHQVLVEAAQNLLGVLAGLNRRYYSPFQLKHMHRFLDELRLAPPNLAARLDNLLVVDHVSASADLEQLVRDTVHLVDRHMPEVDTSAVRRSLGKREQPWRADLRQGS